MGIGIFLVLSLVKWSESKKEQVVYHDSVVIEHNNKNYLTFLLIPLVLLGILFTFEKPRGYVKSLYEEYFIKIQPSKKTFSLTDNLSPYALMPNPTFEEWKIFLKNNENNNTKEDYTKFIEIKNSLESTNLLINPLFDDEDIPDSDSDKTIVYQKCNVTLDIDYMNQLLDLEKRTPNSIVNYYIGVLGLHLGGNKEKRIIESLKDFRQKSFRKYANNLEYFIKALKNKNFHDINQNNHLISSCYYLDFNVTDKLDINTLLIKESSPSCSYEIILKDENITEKIGKSDEILKTY